MSRIHSRSAALLAALVLCLSVPLVGASTAYAANDDLCAGQPNCTVVDPPGIGNDPGFGSDSGIPGAFVLLFVLMLIGGVALTIWKVGAAQRMARESGMNESDAAAMTLLSDDGFEATYLAANLRGKTQPASPPQPVASAAERLRALGELRDQGLITTEEYDARRAAIIDSV
jgi:hypothetical protein